jgi:hypothetical protein
MPKFNPALEHTKGSRNITLHLRAVADNDCQGTTSLPNSYAVCEDQLNDHKTVCVKTEQLHVDFEFSFSNKYQVHT